MPKVLLLGPHPLDGWSMRRYTHLLAGAYQSLGWEVVALAPGDRISRHLKGATARKAAKYFETVVLFSIRLVFRPRASVTHLADHSNALWLMVPGRRSVTVATCHDLIAVRAARGEFPEHRSSWLGRLFQSLTLRGLGRADLVAAVSQATAEDVARLLPSCQVAVTYNPLTPPFGEGPVISPEQRGDFALLVASSGWRKRRDRGIEYWRSLREHMTTPRLRLVAVGPPLSRDELAAAGDALVDVDVRTGVTDVELAELYRAARLLIHPSAFEGFGWPIIEANAAGTPALCTDISTSREVGPSNVFISVPFQEADWAAVARLIREFSCEQIATDTRLRYSLEVFTAELQQITRAALRVPDVD